MPESQLPVIVLAGLRDDHTDVAAMSLTCSLPDAASLRYDLVEDGIRRRRHQGLDLVEDVIVEMEGDCVSCALRGEMTAQLLALAEQGCASSTVLRLPSATEPLMAVRAVELCDVDGIKVHDHLRVASVVTPVAGDMLLGDLFGDQRLDELDAERYADDDRTVGEVVAAQLETCDVAFGIDGSIEGQVCDALHELCRPGAYVLADACDLTPEILLERPRDHAAADKHVHMTSRAPAGAHPWGVDVADVSLNFDSAVWTVSIDTSRPFHPQRLMEELENIGGSSVRSRGCFWLPTRPDAVSVWDGAGGQLCIGSEGTWGARRPRTRIVVTGLGPGRDEVMAAARRTLMTDAELVGGTSRWLGMDDGFDPWLGAASDVA